MVSYKGWENDVDINANQFTKKNIAGLDSNLTTHHKIVCR